jgi:hypothetical protein
MIITNIKKVGDLLNIFINTEGVMKNESVNPAIHNRT